MSPERAPCLASFLMLGNLLMLHLWQAQWAQVCGWVGIGSWQRDRVEEGREAACTMSCLGVSVKVGDVLDQVAV